MKLVATFLAVSGAIKCRNRGIEHVTGSGEEFCECVDSFWVISDKNFNSIFFFNFRERIAKMKTFLEAAKLIANTFI